jgi:cardiolipin synthase
MQGFNLFHKVSDIWEAQLKDIENAKESVLLEQYIMEDFHEGGIGRRFVDALIKKAREGVEVRCILDAQGCFDLFRNDELNDALTSAGATIFYYKTLGATNIITPARLFLRDHRKLVVVDERTTWIGGAVVGERFRDWDDLMGRFEDVSLAAVASSEFRQQQLRLEEKEVLLAPLVRVDEGMHLIGNAPGIGNRFCYEEICHAIMLAKDSVTIVTPYFAPPFKLKRVINRRLRDGLKMTLIVPRSTDHRLADLARETFLPRMVRDGMTLLYTDSMVHAKIVIVDDDWMTFGSTNLDALSLVFNHELNLVTTHTPLIRGVQDIVNVWREQATPVDERSCEYRNHSWLERLIGRSLRYIA